MGRRDAGAWTRLAGEMLSSGSPVPLRCPFPKHRHRSVSRLDGFSPSSGVGLCRGEPVYGASQCFNWQGIGPEMSREDLYRSAALIV